MQKKYLKFLARALFSLLILFFILSKIDLIKFWLILKQVNLIYFVISLTFYLISFMFLTKRWQLICHFLSLDFIFLHLLKFNFISCFYGTFLPGGPLTGELIKCYKVVKQEKNLPQKIVASVILDRLYGLLTLSLLAVVAVLLTSEKNFFIYSKIVVIICTITVIFIGLIVILNNQRLFNFFIAPFKILVCKIKKCDFNNYLNFHLEKIFAGYNFRHFFKNILIVSLLIHIFYSLMVYILALSVDIHVSLLSIVWINALVTLFTAIPITILGLGIREASFITLLALLNVTNERALTLSFLILMIYVIVALIGGCIEFNYNFIKNK